MPEHTATDPMARLKQLKLERGIASRAVGEAKKAKQPVDDLIQQVKSISAEIREIEEALKSDAEAAQDANDRTKPETRLPPQFGAFDIDDNEAAPTCDISINETSDEEWDNYVNAHPQACIYHSSAIKRVIVDSFDHKPVYFAARDTRGKLVGVLPLIEIDSALFGHSLTSVPFFNYGGLIADHPAVHSALVEAAGRYAVTCQAEHIELRHCRNFLDLPSKSLKVAMIRPLPGTPAELWSDIGTKVRAQINKAKRAGARVKTGRDELIDDFYRVFCRNMRDLGTPVYSKSLFQNMMRHHPSAHIIAVYIGEQPVAAGFVLGWRDTLEIPWASTIREANRFDANMRLYWAVLKFAIEQGYQLFDFGRSDQDSSTYRFKKQWGAQAQPLYWHYWLPQGASLPQVNKHNPKYRIMIETWKRLPLFVANMLGPGLVKNIP